MQRACACIAALAVSMGAWGAQAEFFDDFDAVELDSAWDWYVPAQGPFYTLDAGEFILDLPTGEYDTWVGFEHGPRLRTTNFAPDENFSIETRVTVEVPGFPEYYQTGLWVGFNDLQGGPVDGWFYGFYSQPDWVGNYTIKTERIGQRSPAFGINFPVPWGYAETHLKIERIGERYVFFYKQGLDDAWILFHTTTCPGETVIDVGLFAKNWGGRNAAIRARFDYFRIGDPASVLPEFDQPADDVASADLVYCTTLVPRQAYPPPTWALAVDPAPVAAAAIDANGRVTWTPGAADVGTTFTFTATAANTAGSVPVKWNIVAMAALREEFDGPELAPGFEFFTPQTGPTLTFDAGYARLAFGATGDQGLDYNAWSGFDRMPRVQAPLAVCGDFAVEAVLTVVEPAGTASAVHGGIWIGFAGGFDGLMWGPYGGAAQLRLERMGVNMPWTNVLTTGGAELGLRVRRLGDEFTFSYRDGPDADWVEHWKQSYAGAEVNAVGVCAKNYGPVPVTFDIDYLHAGPPPVEAPVLTDPCPDAITTTTVGSMLAKRLAYRPGSPLPTEIVVDGPGAFDAGSGIYTVVPSAAGESRVTITATMAGVPPATVSFRVKAFERTAHFEDFEVDVPEDLLASWELYNPALIDPSPFSIAGDVGARALSIHTGTGVPYDHWLGVDNALQARVSALGVTELTGDFTIEAKISLREYNAGGVAEPFHTGITVGFGTNQLYYLGFYNGTNLVLERSGANNLASLANTAETVTFRVRRECDTFHFLAQPEGGQWQLLSVQSQPLDWMAPPAFVGVILKTYGFTGATVTVDCDYFDIFADVPGPTEPQFRRGDVNQDGAVNIADAIALLGHLFASKPAPACRDAADANDDGVVNIADAIRILGHLFASTGPLPAPSNVCGPDPTADTIPACEFDPAKCP